MATIRKRNRPLPYYVSWPEADTKQQRHKSSKRMRKAEDFWDTVSTELRQGTYIDRRPVPFRTFATNWLARTRPTISPNTHALHEWAVNGYLIPAFNLLPIQNFRAERIEGWQADLLRGGKLRARSVEICRGVLNTILEDARAKGYIFVSPMEKVRRFDIPERELSFLKPLQVKALCELDASNPLR